VLLVTPLYAPSLGGVQTCAREVATRLVKRRVDARVLTADPTHRLPRTEMLDGVPVQRVPAWPRHQDYGFAPAIGPVIRRARSDVIHVQCYQTLVAPIAMNAAWRSRTPYVVTFHGGGHSSTVRHSLRRAQLNILGPLLARSAALVATAEWEIEHYSSILGLAQSRFVLIPNGGDLPVPVDPPSPARGTLIVSVGRAERYKGHHRVLAALPHVLKELPDARLWIAGEGPYEPQLEQLARRLGVADRVEIRAEHDRAAYAQRLAGASVAALLSDFESHPMAALEAISLGVPMLVADNSGLAELAAHGHADAVSPSADSRVVAAEMIRLVKHPPRRRAPAVISSWEACVDQHELLYARVLGNRIRAPGAATAGLR
jgi:glycosyltransferase involved in cell wall biosynthesis